jgi:hypothetical protein
MDKFDLSKVPARDHDLYRKLMAAVEAYEAMTPEQKEAHDKAQRESFVRAMMPTGDPRFD